MLMDTASTAKQENEPRLREAKSFERRDRRKEKMITEIDKRQKENDELLVAKKKELENTDRLLEEARKGSLLEVEKRNTMFDVSKSLTGNNLQSPADGQKVLNFNDVKWEEKPFTGEYGVHLTDHDSAFVISTNVISLDDVICFGLHWKYGERRTPNECYSVAFLQVKNIEITKLNLQPTLTDFALTTCKGAFHIVGGAFVIKHYNSYNKTGKESNLILSCVGQTKMESNYPPMKTASASPAVVTYKERIVVVHGRGANGEIEVLDTNNVNPVWVQLRAHLPACNTPSATIVGNTLVVWVGGLYCTSLEYVTASTQHQLPPGIYPFATPPINLTGYPLNGRLLTLRGQLVAIGRPQVEGCGMRIYAFRSATREWVNIDNRKQFDMALTTSATSLTVFQLPKVYPSYCMGYIGSV